MPTIFDMDDSSSFISLEMFYDLVLDAELTVTAVNNRYGIVLIVAF